jgi:hypothetical protein
MTQTKKELTEEFQKTELEIQLSYNKIEVLKTEIKLKEYKLKEIKNKLEKVDKYRNNEKKILEKEKSILYK